MHVLMAEELAALLASEEVEPEVLREAVKRCFGRMDELAMSACACGRLGPQPCLCGRPDFSADFVGSTAVVALIGRDLIVVANCGDSRAVLCRGGIALPVSDDHKVTIS